MQHLVFLDFLIEDDVKNHQKKVIFEILIFSRFLAYLVPNFGFLAYFYISRTAYRMKMVHPSF